VHACFPRREPRGQFFAAIVGPCRALERPAIEPIALHGEGGALQGLQRGMRDGRWDAEQRLGHTPQLGAAELGAPDGIWRCDETGGGKKGKDSVGVARPVDTL
jgi:SRSO17 transposase